MVEGIAGQARNDERVTQLTDDKTLPVYPG